MDYGDIVVHVFTEERRDYYALDSLWGDADRFDATGLGLETP
jgi:ribosome-associated protein